MVLPGLQLGFFETVKTTVLSGYLALPHLLIIITGFLAAITANLGLTILVLGQLFIVPVAQFVLGFLRKTSFFTDTMRLGAVPKLDPSCSLVPDIAKAGNFSSPITSDWVAHVSFFFSFVFFNAFTIYNLQPAQGASPINVENREAQALMSMILSLVVAIGLLVSFKMISKCETTGSWIVGTLIFSVLGFAWYSFASLCGIKQTDIFGVASKIHTLKPDSEEYAKVCVPLKNDTCKK
jgi:hypothetical protein